MGTEILHPQHLLMPKTEEAVSDYNRPPDDLSNRSRPYYVPTCQPITVEPYPEHLVRFDQVSQPDPHEPVPIHTDPEPEIQGSVSSPCKFPTYQYNEQRLKLLRTPSWPMKATDLLFGMGAGTRPTVSGEKSITQKEKKTKMSLKRSIRNLHVNLPRKWNQSLSAFIDYLVAPSQLFLTDTGSRGSEDSGLDRDWPSETQSMDVALVEEEHRKDPARKHEDSEDNHIDKEFISAHDDYFFTDETYEQMLAYLRAAGDGVSLESRKS